MFSLSSPSKDTLYRLFYILLRHALRGGGYGDVGLLTRLEGRWKSVNDGNSLAAYPTARCVRGEGKGTPNGNHLLYPIYVGLYLYPSNHGHLQSLSDEIFILPRSSAALKHGIQYEGASEKVPSRR